MPASSLTTPVPPAPGRVPRRHWPTHMVELAPAERLIVWALRRWVLGLHADQGDHWRLVAGEFRRQFGAADSAAALEGQAGLVRALHNHACRRIRHYQPCCPCLTADEARVVCLVAACQNQDPAMARAALRGMTTPDGMGDLLAGAGRLAAIMIRHRLRLPDRATETRPAGRLH